MPALSCRKEDSPRLHELFESYRDDLPVGYSDRESAARSLFASAPFVAERTVPLRARIVPPPPPGQPTDEELLERFRAGDRRAFDSLMKRHQVGLFNFIHRSVRDRATAEELLQDTWLRVLAGAQDFQRASKFSTWVYTVARNLCIDQARKAVLRRHPSLDQSPRSSDEGPTLGETLADQGPQADRSAISKELQERLIAAIHSLPDDQREVFMLREYASLPFKEIAEVVGAPENTVKSRMRYALERLQSALAEFEDYARALG
jgi:RNA polymerase sigma-70 factor (ECF subfamily)